MQKLRKDIFEKKAIFSRLWDCYINADSLVKIPIFPFSHFPIFPFSHFPIFPFCCSPITIASKEKSRRLFANTGS